MPRPAPRPVIRIVAVTLAILLAGPLLGCRSQELPAEKKPSGAQPHDRSTDAASSIGEPQRPSEQVETPAPEIQAPAEPTEDSSPPPVSGNGPIIIEPMVVVFEEPLPSSLEEPLSHSSTPPKSDPAPPGPEKARPKVAIIIDDMGYHQHLGERLLALDLNLTYAFLPNAPFTGEQAARAEHQGREVLVHVPMEPKDPRWHPGEEALSVNDSPEDLRRKLLAMLADVPQATGINNHMGSRLTERADAMQTVMEILRARSLYFIDSFTSGRSQGLNAAKQLGLPGGRREVFLDNVQDVRQICGQMETLASVAAKKGGAIGIGHPYEATVAALRECGPQLLLRADLVRAGELVH